MAEDLPIENSRKRSEAAHRDLARLVLDDLRLSRPGLRIPRLSRPGHEHGVLLKSLERHLAFVLPEPDHVFPRRPEMLSDLRVLDGLVDGAGRRPVGGGDGDVPNVVATRIADVRLGVNAAGGAGKDAGEARPDSQFLGTAAGGEFSGGAAKRRRAGPEHRAYLHTPHQVVGVLVAELSIQGVIGGEEEVVLGVGADHAPLVGGFTLVVRGVGLQKGEVRLTNEKNGSNGERRS